ncbi:MAG: putative addiction module antidote protein, partial [Deltaproteobacteria bacterium]|nr:putative addiction module antidote protein [Deltaproteobacteria bacterium]
AIGNVAKAQGMTEIARKTNLSRQNLYKALSPNATPKFDTVKKVVEALGCKLAII